MEIKEQIKLRFTGVEFPVVDFKSSRSSTDLEEREIKVNIDPKVFFPKDTSNTFNIIMNVDVSADDYFTLHMVAVGYFELSQIEIEDEVRKSFVNANSTAIMFPYVRAFVSMLTSNVGKTMNSILLPTRFFKGELKEVGDEQASEI